MRPPENQKETKKGLTLRPETWRELLPILLAEVGTADPAQGDAEASDAPDPLAGDV